MSTTNSTVRRVIGCVAMLAGCAACGSGTSTPTSRGPATLATTPATGTQTAVPAESNPPGDIPDNLAFVAYRNKAGGYRFVHPEGWAQVAHSTSVSFTDKLNGVAVAVTAARSAPTVGSAKSVDVPRLQNSVPAFELRSVSAVTLPAGAAVLIVFRRNSDPDPVTGRRYRDEVNEYLVWHHGREVHFDLYGPVGADNIDAYRTMSQSLRVQ
jgi:hypothetical protein